MPLVQKNIIFATENLHYPMKAFSPKYILSIFLFLGFSTAVFGQDLIARQAPIDRRMKSVDSLAINRVIKKVLKKKLELNEIYPSWNTSKVHCYNDAEIPETFNIDLRGFKMPTPSRLITSRFGYRQSFRRMHKGLDIKVYTGDTIVSAFDGKVRIVDYEAAGYGYYVVIRHPNGLETIYGHLSKQLVKAGEEVKAGDVIGLGGNTGRSFGSHLHFETRFLGIAINPELMFDFVNQDVTGDFFVFRNSDCNRGVLAHASTSTSKRDEFLQGGHATAHQNEDATPAGKFYQVKRGDNLSNIAGKIGVSVDNLCRLNGIRKNSKLKPGQILRY